jgi:hypothetical protein
MRWGPTTPRPTPGAWVPSNWGTFHTSVSVRICIYK